ncbi:hypothetical protein RWV98_17560 [Agathobaculum sp. NTUH-O15-33]|uniref:hypothetical protein n=1 Tax=Agathobaculum sp. NTUH-O15-33 TaxID=3079302 RepID=UPI002958AE4C|nr:hypothetical protein [Agathobaculum sp. NTUH-O15-33]WNX84359.1 hypothetical protein RWV98_17560 [Agathobaculum sp. NTUH-O15-33]
MNVLIVDGKTYNIDVTSLKRSASVLDGTNAGRVLSGLMVRDIIGTYYNYDLTFGRSSLSPADYDALYETLTAPVDYHTITVPYGQETKTFRAYVSNASDVLRRMTDKVNLWGELTIKFTAMEPDRRP